MADTINLSSEEDTTTTDKISSTSVFEWGGFSDHNYGSTLTTADLSAMSITNTTGTVYTIGSGGTGLGHANVVWSTPTTTTSPYYTATGTGVGQLDQGMTVNQGGKISLQGDKADVDINGKSLVQWMQAMEERMNWMQHNVEMEKEWDELRELGDRYRELEKQCKEKSDMWKKLKSMPQPDIK